MTEVTFQWNSGGNDVKIAGSFNCWKPENMIKTGEKWIYRNKLPSGNYTYKFIADSNWYYDKKLPTMVDEKGITNNIMVIDNNNYKAASLISIVNNNLELKNIINNFKAYKDNNIKVVSILGSARMGKSTLLNTIISKYTNYNNNVFTTSKSSTNHCTNGIDLIYVPGMKIVFCDVQGLNHDNSANDPKLLLITYLMSDIIIFTEPKMLNKNTLTSLSPLASFLTYLDAKQIDDNDSKPSLVFRISDFTLAGKPQENLDKLLTENNDQHKNLIINMKKLFKDIKAFKTEQLDRSELKMLDGNNFIGLLESNENGFNAFISELNEYLDKIPSKINFEKWYANLNKFIGEINANNKIDFNKLDIYYQIAEKELLEYENDLRKNKKELFTVITVDHTQKDFIEKIKSRVDKRDEVQKVFNSKFKVVNDNIKKKHYGELMDDINKHITLALKSNYDQGMKIMTDYIKTSFQKNIINELTLQVGDLDLTESEKYLKTMDINEEVNKTFNIWKDKINSNYKKKKKAVIELQKIEIDKYKVKMEKYLTDFTGSIRDVVLLKNFKGKNYDATSIDEISKFLSKTYDNFKLEIKNTAFNIFNDFSKGIIQYMMIVDIDKSKPTFNDFDIIFEVKNNDFTINYKYFNEISEKLEKIIYNKF